MFVMPLKSRMVLVCPPMAGAWITPYLHGDSIGRKHIVQLVGISIHNNCGMLNFSSPACGALDPLYVCQDLSHQEIGEEKIIHYNHGYMFYVGC